MSIDVSFGTITGQGTIKCECSYNSGTSWVQFYPPHSFVDDNIYLKFTAQPAAGYHWTNYVINGTPIAVNPYPSNSGGTVTYSNLVIGATFTANQYTATFNGRGGTPATSTQQYTYGAQMQTLPGVSRAGYVLNAGWRDHDNIATIIYPSTIYSWASDKTFDAHWAWNITYEPNGGTGSTTYSDYAAEEQTITVVTTTSTRSGYRFAGWNTAADGTGTDYTVGQVCNGPSKTLYAQWEPVAHKRVGNDWAATPVYKRVNDEWVEISVRKMENGEWVDV